MKRGDMRVFWFTLIAIALFSVLTAREFRPPVTR